MTKSLGQNCTLFVIKTKCNFAPNLPNFPGWYLRTPVARGVALSSTHSQHGLLRKRKCWQDAIANCKLGDPLLFWLVTCRISRCVWSIFPAALSQLSAGEKFAAADHSWSDEFGRPSPSRTADRPPTIAVAHASQSQSCPRYDKRTAG